MPNANSTQTPAEKNAQKMFRPAAQNNKTIKQTGKSERTQVAAKTARLRGLRLAMEAQQEAAEKSASENGETRPAQPAKRKRAAAKAAHMVRMIY